MRTRDEGCERGLKNGAPALNVTNLSVIVSDGGGKILDDVSTGVGAGRVLAVVGESGSGKTTLALSTLGYARRGARVTGGHIWLAGKDVVGLTDAALREIRARLVAYIPQDPFSALNPGMRVGAQMGEALSIAQPRFSRDRLRTRIKEAFESVQLPSDVQFLRRYPHQLSGGQLQRVAIAMAITREPALLLMDEPTTALDVTTQAQVLSLVNSLVRGREVAVLYVTHDLGVAAQVADDIVVMYAGLVVESGPVSSVLRGPLHPYTQGLLAASPELASRTELIAIPGKAPAPGSQGSGCVFAPRCSWVIPECTMGRPPLVASARGGEGRAACIRIDHIQAHLESDQLSEGWEADAHSLHVVERGCAAGQDADAEENLLDAHVTASFGKREVVHDVSLTIPEGRYLALVGESGSGKTTFARSVAGLHKEAVGHIALGGRLLPFEAHKRAPEARLAIQYVFQNPYSSLNPRRNIRKCLLHPLQFIADLPRGERDSRVIEALEQVELSSDLLSAYPDELSGGQRQRVAIARALVVQPRLLICDEVTSGLDVSVQAAVVKTLQSLQARVGLTMLFVTHNIALANTIADSIVVMKDGTIVEQGSADQVFGAPRTDYVRRLIVDVPSLRTGTK